jgi:hypothetical protein
MVMTARGQTSSDTSSLRTQLRSRYDILALKDGVGLVPHQRNGNIRLIEIRNGGVAINGSTVSARELRERLGKDAEPVLRVTYLSASAQRELAREDSPGTTSQTDTRENANKPEPASPQPNESHDGDLVRIGGSINVGRGEIVDGDAVAIGGSANIDGEVTRDVVVIGGSLNLGPNAVVRRDVAVVGGSLERATGSQVYGKVSNVGFGPQFPFRRRLELGLPHRTPLLRRGGLLGTLLRVTLLILGAFVVVVLGRRFVEAIGDRAATDPLRSGLAGLATEILFVPLLIITVIVLAVSIIGIPLLILVPFGIVLAVILMFVGFTGIAYQVGRFLSDRLGIKRGPYADVALGVLALVGITLVAKLIALTGGFLFGGAITGLLTGIGYLVEYIAWTVGIGAALLTWLRTRRSKTPAAVVAAPTAGEAHVE